jgi:hypothetical protein
MTGDRANRISVSTKIIIFYVRQWAFTYGIIDTAGRTYCYRYMKSMDCEMQQLCRLSRRSHQSLDGVEDGMFEESKFQNIMVK